MVFEGLEGLGQYYEIQVIFKYLLRLLLKSYHILDTEALASCT